MEQFFASVTPGLEAISVGELETLGLSGVRQEGRGGVTFSGEMSDAMEANRRGRTLGRVLLRVASFRASRRAQLIKKVSDVDWSRFVRSGHAPITVKASAHKSRLHHTTMIEEVVDAAVRETLPAKGGRDDAQTVYVRIDRDRVTLSVDMSGEHLHRRGYRIKTTAAPLRENTAAAILMAAGWEPSMALVDPMVGSGTFVIEAARWAAGIPPGTGRTFAFQSWPLASSLSTAPGPVALTPAVSAPRLFGSDKSEAAIAAARDNARRGGVADRVTLEVAEVFAARPQTSVGLIVANPPYGRRLGSANAAVRLTEILAKVFRRFEGWNGALLSVDRRALDVFIRALGAPPSNSLRFDNGGIATTLSLFGL